MELDGALARVRSWADTPRLRPELGVAKDVAVALGKRIEQLEVAASGVLRHALDDVAVPPCDQNDDGVRARGFSGPMADLYAAVHGTPS